MDREAWHAAVHGGHKESEMPEGLTTTAEKQILLLRQGFPGGSVVKNPLANAGVQFGSVAQLCPTVCDPVDCSTSGFPVHHYLPELAQIYVH